MPSPLFSVRLSTELLGQKSASTTRHDPSTASHWFNIPLYYPPYYWTDFTSIAPADSLELTTPRMKVHSTYNSSMAAYTEHPLPGPDSHSPRIRAATLLTHYLLRGTNAGHGQRLAPALTEDPIVQLSTSTHHHPVQRTMHIVYSMTKCRFLSFLI